MFICLTGAHYYYCAASKITTWDVPPDFIAGPSGAEPEADDTAVHTRRPRLRTTPAEFKELLTADEKVLMAFFEKVDPSSATLHNVRNVIEDFKEQAASTGGNWRSLLFDKLQGGAPTLTASASPARAPGPATSGAMPGGKGGHGGHGEDDSPARGALHAQIKAGPELGDGERKDESDDAASGELAAATGVQPLRPKARSTAIQEQTDKVREPSAFKPLGPL